jgi:hypothetical protein
MRTAKCKVMRCEANVFLENRISGLETVLRQSFHGDRMLGTRISLKH